MYVDRAQLGEHFQRHEPGRHSGRADSAVYDHNFDDVVHDDDSDNFFDDVYNDDSDNIDNVVHDLNDDPNDDLNDHPIDNLVHDLVDDVNDFYVYDFYDPDRDHGQLHGEL